jgi:hypothetical protein
MRKILAALVFSACAFLSSKTDSQVAIVTISGYGDCIHDDTPGFAAATATALAPGGARIIGVPPGCFLVNAQNLINQSNLVILGNGPGISELRAESADAAGNWMDHAGSSNVSYENLTLSTAPSVVPVTMIFFASTGNAFINHDGFENVVIKGTTSGEAVFDYGLGWNGNGAYSTSGTINGAGGLFCRDSVIIQTNNGVANANPSLRNAALRMDGINSVGRHSANVAISTAALGDNGNVLDNCPALDDTPGFGAGAQDNNAAFVAVTTGTTVVDGGSMKCLCVVPAVFYANNEGFSFNETMFGASDNSFTVDHMIEWGGGQNSDFTFINPFFSTPRQMFLGFGPPVNGAGGINKLTIKGTDIGGNPAGGYFMLTTFSCGSPVLSYWYTEVNIDLDAAANKVQARGSVDPTSKFTNLASGGITLPGGATDYSHHF